MGAGWPGRRAGSFLETDYFHNEFLSISLPSLRADSTGFFVEKLLLWRRNLTSLQGISRVCTQANLHTLLSSVSCTKLLGRYLSNV